MQTYEVVDNDRKVRHTVAAETYEINASRAAFWKTLGDYHNSHNPIVSVAVEPGWLVRVRERASAADDILAIEATAKEVISDSADAHRAAIAVAKGGLVAAYLCRNDTVAGLEWKETKARLEAADEKSKDWTMRTGELKHKSGGYIKFVSSQARDALRGITIDLLVKA